MGQEQARASPAAGLIELTDVPPSVGDSLAVVVDYDAGLHLLE